METTKFSELLTLLIVLPFPECHIVEIMQIVAFLDWLLSLGNVHLRFLHVFLFVYVLNNILLHGFLLVDFILPLIEGLLGCLGFGNYE